MIPCSVCNRPGLVYSRLNWKPHIMKKFKDKVAEVLSSIRRALKRNILTQQSEIPAASGNIILF